MTLIDELIEDDEDDEFFAIVLLSVSGLQYHRSDFVVRQRLSWETHVHKLLCESEGSFDRMYRMPYRSFMKLRDLLATDLQKDEEMSRRRTGKSSITPEITLHCLLRWLAGGSYLDIRIVAGISPASFYRAIHNGMDAIMNCETLSYHFPTTAKEIEDAAGEFRRCSSHELLRGCVACVEGFLLRIQTPKSSETGNVKAYFSGHYQAYGINVQAACDSRCRFVEVCVASPGGVNDVVVFRKTKIKQYADSLPCGKYVIGDNAYIPTEHMITPFSGSNRNIAGHDAFNFFVSQLRIKIEQAFGFLTTKWRILRRPIQMSVTNTSRMFMVLTRIHNYVINERDTPITASDIEVVSSTSATQRGYIPSDTTVCDLPGTSMIRDIIVAEVNSRALERPQYNLTRNQ